VLEFFRPVSLWPKVFYGTFGRFVLPVVGGMVSGDGAAYRYLNDSIARFVSIGEAEELFAKSGFTAIRKRSCFGGVSHALAGTKG
jgi:demethylmenaquinone methyltransferase/2-methoxy-6-polyprenyl-1,4-benzoquinol methylase